MRRVGILGGTFNPIHIGHLLLGEYVKEELGLQEIWFLPTGCSYMKSSGEVLSAQERYIMTELAIQDNVDFSCLDTEIKRSGNSYTCDTLIQLRQEAPDCEFYFIVGTDCLFEIESWKSPEIIFENCSLVVAAREDASMEEMRKKKEELCAKYGAIIVLLPFMKLPISSTEIRNRLALGKSVRYMLPERVNQYIEEKGFYRGYR